MTAELRVLAVIDGLAPCGAEKSLLTQMENIRQFGISPTIVALKGPNSTDLVPRDGSLPIYLGQCHGMMAKVRGLRRLIAQHQPHVLHTSLFAADLVGRVSAAFSRVPVLTSLVNTNFDKVRLTGEGIAPWKVGLGTLVETGLSPLSSRFHAISQTVADDAEDRLFVGSDRIHVVYRGRDRRALGTFTPQRQLVWRQREGIDADRLVLVAVARHERQKSLHTLLDALALPEMRALNPLAVFVGRDGTATEDLHRRASELGVTNSTKWLGVRDDVADVICGADALVLPSLWEGLGGVLIEAMALDTPVVCSDLAVTREVVGEAGHYFRPSDPRSLVNAVSSLRSEFVDTQHKVRIGRNRFETLFEIKTVCNQMANLYDLTASSPRFPGRRPLCD